MTGLALSSDLKYYVRPGWTVHYLPRTESTNNVAVAAGQQGTPGKLLVITDEQTSGRGRLNRRWNAPVGDCLLMSLLLYPPPPFERNAGRVTMACGLALCEAIVATTEVPAVLKWPNDLIVNDVQGGWRKIAGMLSEIGLRDGLPHFVVVGIGLNVNVPVATLSELSPNATSLLAETGRQVERTALLDAFLSRVETLYRRLERGEDLLPLWRAHLAWKGQSVRLQTPTKIVEGVFEDVDEAGALWVRLSSGERRCFMVGDVTLRRA
ncbi:MAG: biotin--[acetyl-CoA-carboxylase] ligase [Anaerolineae bacterium]|nr:biotin--[acetyl-CoA-carboxylase] ligase [Anaerolineae bacterium]